MHHCCAAETAPLHSSHGRNTRTCCLQALELSDLQQQLQQLQIEYAVPSPDTDRPPTLHALATLLARFTVDHLLQQRSASRAAFAERLGLLMSPQAPFPPLLLAAFLASRGPVAAALFPDAPVYFLLNTAPRSVSLWAAELRRGKRTGIASSKVPLIPRRRWLSTRCYLVVGVAPPEATRLLGELPNRHLRLCGALVVCIVDAVGSVRHVDGMEVMPARVFRCAQELFETGVGVGEVLRELDSHGQVAARGWWGEGGARRAARWCKAFACQQIGFKRSRDAMDGRGAEHAPRKVERIDCKKEGSAILHAASQTEDARSDVGAGTGPVSTTRNGKSSVQVLDRAPGASGQSKEGNLHPWGPADVGLERLQVACMLAWARVRALAQHIRVELDAAGVSYAEEWGARAAAPPAEVGAGPGKVAKALRMEDGIVFELHRLPMKGGASMAIPEGHIAWPRLLLDPAHASGEPQSGGVRAAKLVLTGSSSWQLRVEAPLLCSVLRTLPPGHSWRLCPDEASTLVRDYDLASPNVDVSQCWLAVAALLLARSLFVMFAVLQRPDARGMAPPVATPPTSAVLSFPYPGVTVTVDLASLSCLRVRVIATDATTAAGTDAPPGTLLQELLVTFPVEHRLKATPVQPASNLATTQQLWQSLDVHADAVIAPRVPIASELDRYLNQHLRAADLQQFLDTVAYTTVAHTALFAATQPDAIARLHLRHVRIGVVHTGPPYRVLLQLATLTKRAALEGMPVFGEFGVGIQIRAEGVATLHFDLRQEQAAKVVFDKRHRAPQEERGWARMPQEVPKCAALIREMLEGDSPLASRVDDVRALVKQPLEGGLVVMVQQGKLGDAVAAISRHVDAYLSLVMPS
jgi:hypothetical protein